MIKFYTDSHIGKAIATQARQRGIDIIRCQEIGKENDTDDSHLAYASTEGRTIITADQDFFRLHDDYQAVQKSHAGIIFVQPEQKDNVGLIVNYLEFLHLSVNSEAATLEGDIYNKILYLYE